MNVDRIAARVWPGRSLTIEALGGGITNHNFKVSHEDGVFVLRIGGKDTELLGIDRRAEYEASRVAAALGVGPEVVAFLEPEGYLVTQFIEGRVFPPEEIRRPDALSSTAETLRLVHGGPAVPGRFNSFRVVEAYHASAVAHGVRVPGAFDDAKALADRIERAFGPTEDRPCHNDLLNANFIHDGERIRIVDWEYAGMGDRFFDLANFSINHELTEPDDRALLTAYFGALDEADLARQRLMRFMSDFREAMWGVVQQGISDLDVDFVDYARRHFERLERTAGRRDFADALAALE